MKFISRHINTICCVLSLLVAAYAVVGIVMANSMAAVARSPLHSPVRIIVHYPDSNRFVTREQIARLVAPKFPDIKGGIIPSRVNTLAIEQLLNSIDNIEEASVTRRADDRLWIEVTPMRPVARIFNDHGSYYINRDGKTLTASPVYRCDVPVITGNLSGLHSASRLMPLLDYIAGSKARSEYVAALSLEDDGDVIIIPPIRGHVVNMGDPSRLIANKFARLSTMYHQVIAVKGWDYYDTLSVKFDGQVVATRRRVRPQDPLLVLDPTGEGTEDADVSTMTVN